MANCSFPGCKERAVENKKGCIFHGRHFGEKTEKKTRQPIKKVSEKRKEVNKELSALYKAIIAIRPYCEIRSPECTGKSETGHHIAGRDDDIIVEPSNIMSVCFRCNGFVEEHHQWAIDNGFKKSKFYKN